jgi:hypothetical protein
VIESATIASIRRRSKRPTSNGENELDGSNPSSGPMKVLRVKSEKPADYRMCASDGSSMAHQPPIGCCDDNNPFNNNDFEGSASNLSAGDLLASTASALFCATGSLKMEVSDSEELLPPCKYSEAAAELQRASSCLQKVSIQQTKRQVFYFLVV